MIRKTSNYKPQTSRLIKKWKQGVLIFFGFWVLMLGFSQTFAAPSRIISTMPSITEILYELGLKDQIVGVTTNCNYPDDAKKKEKIGGLEVNIEKVLYLKPNLVVMLKDAQFRDVMKLNRFRLPVFAVNTSSIRETMDAIIAIGDKTGKTREAQSIVSGMETKLSEIKNRVSLKEIVRTRPKVLVIIGYNPIIAAGGGSFIDDVIKSAGAENICAKVKETYPHISFENLIIEDPEYIVIPKGVVTESEIKNGQRWHNLAAYRNKKILFIDQDIISRPGPRVIEAIDIIASFIYK